ncbi:MAG: helix-turn-helix domain-containing protein [Nitrospirota bacterium]|nr:helix-turn-helix domain-containing protein [Nitrospirota bacterium]
MKITTPRERDRLARECGTTVGYLYQVAGGHRRVGVSLALRLERATSGAVCRCNLRPDLFPPDECLGSAAHRHDGGSRISDVRRHEVPFDTTSPLAAVPGHHTRR